MGILRAIIQVMPLAIDGQKYLIQMPFITRTGTPALKLIGIRLSALAEPWS
jgi:hypothetical protein